MWSIVHIHIQIPMSTVAPAAVAHLVCKRVDDDCDATVSKWLNTFPHKCVSRLHDSVTTSFRDFGWACNTVSSLSIWGQTGSTQVTLSLYCRMSTFTHIHFALSWYSMARSVVVRTSHSQATGRGFESHPLRCPVQLLPSCSHTCASVCKQCNFVLAKGWWCSKARRLIVGLAAHWREVSVPPLIGPGWPAHLSCHDWVLSQLFALKIFHFPAPL